MSTLTVENLNDDVVGIVNQFQNNQTKAGFKTFAKALTECATVYGEALRGDRPGLRDPERKKLFDAWLSLTFSVISVGLAIEGIELAENPPPELLRGFGLPPKTLQSSPGF